MNLLSIMLYLADILGNLSTTFGILGVILLMGFGVLAGISAGNNSDHNRTYSSSKDQYDPNYTASKKWIKRIWIPIVFFLMASLIPAQNTVYMIAASEIAEEGYKSEIGQKLTNIVNEKLDEYITELSAKPVSETIKNIDEKKLTSDEIEYLKKKIDSVTK